MLRQINLNNAKATLTPNDVNQLVSIIGYRCRLKTVNRLESILKYGPSTIPNYGIFDRLIKDKHGWSYVAGQDYTSEIKLVRELILKG